MQEIEHEFYGNLETGGPTNNERVTWAANALRGFILDTALDIDGEVQEDLKTVVGDLICGIMHVAAKCGEDPYLVIKGAIFSANNNYEEESNPDYHEGAEPLIGPEAPVTFNEIIFGNKQNTNNESAVDHFSDLIDEA